MKLIKKRTRLGNTTYLQQQKPSTCIKKGHNAYDHMYATRGDRAQCFILTICKKGGGAHASEYIWWGHSGSKFTPKRTL